MAQIIAKIIPILLLISFGYFIEQKKMLQQSTIDEIKKIVINISLPSVLFITFINMEIKKEYFLVILIIFILLGSLYFVGVALNQIKRIAHPLMPFITTGFTFGLLGVPLYGTVFGVENLEKISILGVGHELFMWFVFFTILKMKFKNEKFSLDVIKGFLKSPLIISVVFGMLMNITGFGIWFQEKALLQGVYKTLQYLGNLATPLILIIIGFGLKFNKKYMKQSILFLMLRMGGILTIGYSFKVLFINKIIIPEPLFDYAYFTFLILPPPFCLPIFVGEYSTNEHKELVNNTVVLGTVVSIAIYIVFIMFI